MRSVLTGSLALIVLYAFTQDKAADKVGAGSNALVNLLKRALSPTVAGLPNKHTEKAFPFKLPGSEQQGDDPKVYSTIYHV
jgi:hypothetical protein